MMPFLGIRFSICLSRTSLASTSHLISPRVSISCQLPLLYHPPVPPAMVATSSPGHSQNGAARRLFDDTELNDLGNSHAGALEDQKFDIEGPASRVTPLPKVQLITLCAVRLVDPIAFTQIFPYVNEMMERLHLTNDPSKIGFYSGLVVSAALHVPKLIWRTRCSATGSLLCS